MIYFPNLKSVISMVLILLACSCKKDSNNKSTINDSHPSKHTLIVEQPSGVTAPKGMVWVKGKTFLQGKKESDHLALPAEMPSHWVTVDGFFIDITEVTNLQYKTFVDATKYVTVAERQIVWEELKTQLPTGTAKPADSLLQPGSLTFNTNVEQITNMENSSQWWVWTLGANWQHPAGPESNIIGKDNYPVVHIAYEDALAYCKWANKMLPTEAQWELASQGNLENPIYPWGNKIEAMDTYANTWQGVFPISNMSTDGYDLIAPIQSYSPNTLGIYDMAGNVWEMTSDVFKRTYYKEIDLSIPIINPAGANIKDIDSNVQTRERVIKGGSYLCNASYCASFRISARMGMNPDSGTDHIGFRTVTTVEMLNN